MFVDFALLVFGALTYVWPERDFSST